MPRQTRSSRLLLMRAARSVMLPEFGPMFGTHFAETEPPAGGGATPTKADPGPKKIELTDDELQARIDAALKAERDAAKEAKRIADEAAATAAAEKNGEWETLANAEKTKREQAERDMASMKIDLAIRDHLTADEKLRDYAGCAKYIKPLIPDDVAGDEAKLAKAIKSAVDQYVTDNPRKMSAGPQPAPSRSGVPSGTNVPASKNGKPVQVAGTASRSF